MAKRLHDTEIWRNSWYRKLPKESKLLWLYLLDACNCAGIVEIDDFEQMTFFIGCKVNEKHLEPLSKQLKIVDSRRVLILDFIDFQYGRLHETHKMKKKVFAELALFGLRYPIDTLSRKPDTVKDKDKDKDILLEEGAGGNLFYEEPTNPGAEIPTPEEISEFCKDVTEKIHSIPSSERREVV